MVILLKDHADQRQVDNLVSWLKSMGFDVHMSVGSHQTLLGLIGDTSTVDIDVRDMGAQAAELLLSVIRHPNKQVQMYITTSNVINSNKNSIKNIKFYIIIILIIKFLQKYMLLENF